MEINAKTAKSQLDVFQTKLGWMAIVGKGKLLHGLSFGHSSPIAAEKNVRYLLDESIDATCWNPKLAKQLRLFAEGEPCEFSFVKIDTSHLQPFATSVILACQKLPWGETATYGELAQRCGSPQAARAVGNTMAKNRCPLVVPCHRVVPSGYKTNPAKLGGFSAPQGVSMKERLLGMERAVACV